MARLAKKTIALNTPCVNRQADAECRQERIILEAIEAEHMRVAQELHDTVCQSLSGVRLSAAALRRKIGSVDGTAREIAHLEEVAAKTIGELHEVVRSLQTVELSPAELTFALEDLARNVSAPAACAFRALGKPGVRDDFAAGQILRIARAALKQVLAGKADAKVSMTWEQCGSDCVLKVGVDVPVFVELEKTLDRRLCWKLILRRAKAIGAKATIEEDGQCLQVVLPARAATSAA